MAAVRSLGCDGGEHVEVGGSSRGPRGGDQAEQGGEDHESDQARDWNRKREAEVLALIAEGLTNTEIAEQLTVSPTTVKSHINHLFAKAGLRDRAQAVNYAYRRGIARPPR
jgi:DNA-binding NarL/FixJ family response regulator